MKAIRHAVILFSQEKSKFKLAVKCIAMCVLTLLFFGSFSYTFIVYFEPEEKELEVCVIISVWLYHIYIRNTLCNLIYLDTLKCLIV